MTFTPKTWADYPSGGTPITAAELNRVEEWVKRSLGPYTPQVPTGTDLNTITEAGQWAIFGSSHVNQPEATTGVLTTYWISTLSGVQLFQAVAGTRGLYQRFRGSQGWSGWRRIDGPGVLAEAAAYTDAQVADRRQPQPLAGLRTGRVALTASTSGNTATGTVAVLRLPVHLGPRVTRWRVRVANRNHRSGASGGSVRLSGLWAGPGWDGAFTAAPTQLVGSVVLPTNGSDYVSPWVAAPLGDGVRMMLSVGLSEAGTVQLAAGGGWQADGTSEGAGVAAAPSGMTRRTTVPLSWAIEAEVGPQVPVVGTWGDSISAGTGNTLLVNDAPLAQWARTHGALPVLMAYPGTGMVEWEDDADHRWAPFRDQRLDAVLHFMGQNDLESATTLAEMQRRYTATISSLTRYGAPVFLATLTPHGGKTTEQDTLRKAYNNWLRTLPDPQGTGLVRDIFDLAAAVSTDDRNLTPALSADGLHVNTAGSAALAGAITRPLAGTP